jgi:UDP-glucose 4-epimerase
MTDRKAGKVFITGVAGFVGSNLARELLTRGYSVIGMDNLAQGRRRNMDSFLDNPGFTFREGDVCDGKAVEEIGGEADYIVHLAAYKIPRYGGASKTLLINTKGTENVLELARKNKSRVVFSSTSDIYGKNKSLPFREESDILIGPTKVSRWSYAVSKIYDEHLCLAYCQEHKVAVTVVRYFGGYGPGQHLTWWGGPQSVFINCALEDKPMPIHGDGRQTRTFIYVSDLIEGTIAAMEKKEAAGEVINIGTTREISILELSRLIWKLVRKDKPRIDYVPYANFHGNYEDVIRRVPDIAKANRMLNFNPRIGLEEGLGLTIDWQRRALKENA